MFKIYLYLIFNLGLIKKIENWYIFDLVHILLCIITINKSKKQFGASKPSNKQMAEQYQPQLQPRANEQRIIVHQRTPGHVQYRKIGQDLLLATACYMLGVGITYLGLSTRDAYRYSRLYRREGKIINTHDNSELKFNSEKQVICFALNYHAEKNLIHSLLWPGELTTWLITQVIVKSWNWNLFFIKLNKFKCFLSHLSYLYSLCFSL